MSKSKSNAKAIKKVISSVLGDATELYSPSREIVIRLSLTSGIPTYSVSYKGVEAIKPSTLGLITSVADFSDDVALEDVSAVELCHDEYSLLSAKCKRVSREYAERTLTYSKENKVMRVTFRAYDDGIAFRYSIDSANPFKISGENTSFVIADKATVWHNERFVTNYEYNHLTDDIIALTTKKRYKQTQMPLLIRKNNLYIEICESNLNGDYCGSTLLPTRHNGCIALITSFVEQQKRPISAPAVFRSPWRYVVIGNAATIIENTFATDLADNPNPSVDYSYVEAGATAWAWLDNERPSNIKGKVYQHNTAQILNHIDLAAEMGWRYFIMDEGWQPKSRLRHENYAGYFDEYESWRKHADKKGVKLVAWCDCADLNTPEKRARIADWKEHGIYGIKVDFFDNENQQTLQLYQDIYSECAKHSLIVIAHGANKSSGEERTYPNVLTREGIYGQEQGSVTAANSVICAFTRYAVGNTDFTEYLVPRKDNVRIGFQLAMSFIYMSGVHCFADGVTNYRTSEAAQILLKNFPTYFDEIKYISGSPESYVILARRMGECWYVAGISNIDTEQTISLDFLRADKEYTADIFTDGDDYLTLNKEEKTLTSVEKITVPLKKNGGFVIKLR